MLRVELKASPVLVTSLTLVHVCAAATLLPLDLALEAKVVIAFAIIISLVRAIRLHALLCARESVVALEAEDQEHCALRTRDGIVHDARVLRSTYVTPALTVINAQVAGERLGRHVLLVKDRLQPEDFRQLRVLLRWARPRNANRTGPTQLV